MGGVFGVLAAIGVFLVNKSIVQLFISIDSFWGWVLIIPFGLFLGWAAYHVIVGIIQKQNIQRRKQEAAASEERRRQEAAASEERRRQEAAAALPPIEPYSPQHIVDTFLSTGKTKLQLENLWGNKFSGRSVEWQGKVRDVGQSPAAAHLEVIRVSISWDYKYMGSGSEPISAYVMMLIDFPLAEKNRLLEFSKGEIIKFGAKLPKSYEDADLRRSSDSFSSFHVTGAYLR